MRQRNQFDALWATRNEEEVEEVDDVGEVQEIVEITADSGVAKSV